MLKINTYELNRVMNIFYFTTKLHLVILDKSSAPVYYYPPCGQSIFKTLHLSAYRHKYPERCIQIKETSFVASILYACPPANTPMHEEEDLNLLLQIFCFYICVKRYIFEYHSSQSEEIESYILNHLSEDLSAQTLSDMYHITKNSVYKIVKSATGQSLGAFIRACRIKRAQALLLQTDLSIAEIAEKCGLLDNNYFSYLFKKDCGMPPSAYRNASG